MAVDAIEMHSPALGDLSKEEKADMAAVNDFDLFIGLILARLYEDRGKMIELSAEDFGLVEDIEDINDEDGRIAIWNNTVRWLLREGYVRYQTEAGYHELVDTFVAIEITEKGLRALNTIPDALKTKSPGKSFGSQLVDLAQQGGFSAVKKAGEKGAGEALGQIGDLIRMWLS